MPRTSTRLISNGSRRIVDLYVAGDTSLEEVQGIVAKAFAIPEGQPSSYSVLSRAARSEVQTIEERLDVGQGKLNMGLREAPHMAAINTRRSGLQRIARRIPALEALRQREGESELRPITLRRG